MRRNYPKALKRGSCHNFGLVASNSQPQIIPQTPKGTLNLKWGGNYLAVGPWSHHYPRPCAEGYGSTPALEGYDCGIGMYIPNNGRTNGTNMEHEMGTGLHMVGQGFFSLTVHP